MVSIDCKVAVINASVQNPIHWPITHTFVLGILNAKHDKIVYTRWDCMWYLSEDTMCGIWRICTIQLQVYPQKTLGYISKDANQHHDTREHKFIFPEILRCIHCPSTVFIDAIDICSVYTHHCSGDAFFQCDLVCLIYCYIWMKSIQIITFRFLFCKLTAVDQHNWHSVDVFYTSKRKQLETKWFFDAVQYNFYQTIFTIF